MELMCPNCTKKLTVQEQFAGQLMKCPLCAGTFMVPGLPSPPPTPPPAPEPAPVAPASAPAAVPTADQAPPAVVATPSAPAELTAPEPLPPPAPAGSATGYQKGYAIYFSPKVLQWVAPIGVVLIFVLQFFPWVDFAPDGVSVFTQNTWQIAFNGGSLLDDEFKETTKVLQEKAGVNVLTIFYLLAFIPTLLLTVASVVQTVAPMKLPPGVTKLAEWRWGLATAVHFLTLLFLVLQAFIGFSFESSYEEKVTKEFKEAEEKLRDIKGEKEKKAAHRAAVAERNHAQSAMHRTFWFYLTIDLHMIALASTFIVFWSGQHPGRPSPRLSLEW
jgi:hypothetical protein